MTWSPRPSYKLAEDTISRADLASLAAWLTTEPPPWLSQGKLVAEIERTFAEKVGAKHAVFVNSGSSANLLAWHLPRARYPAAKRPVAIAPKVAWATSVMPALQLGYEVHLCDADEDTWGLDPVHLRRLCEKHDPSVVLLVHVLGVPCRMDEIRALQESFGFLLIEDSCAAFGSSPIGKTGQLSTYSTFFAHQFSTVEGGFVTTDDREMNEFLRMTRAHGWAADLDEEARAAYTHAAQVDPFREKFTFHLPGFNVRGTEIAAHIGLNQIRRVDEMTATRKANHLEYLEAFSGTAFQVQMVAGEKDEVASIGFGVLALSKSARDTVAATLRREGIETRPVCAGNTARQPFWERLHGLSRASSSLADRIHDCAFQLPNNPSLTPEDVRYIASVARGALR